MNYIVITAELDGLRSVVIVNLKERVFTFADSATLDATGIHLSTSRQELDQIVGVLLLAGYEEVTDAR